MSIMKLHLQWKDIDELVDKLHKEIIKSGIKIEKVYGMPRGGLIPAVMLSHKMNIPLTTYMYTKNTIIVDDICDSGQTLEEVLADNPTAVLHYKSKTSTIKPTLFAKELTIDHWIVYPWELKESKTIQDYKLDK